MTINGDRMEKLNRDDFATQLNTTFKVDYFPGRPTDLKLIQVTELQQRNRQESFALLFQGPGDAVLDQRQHRVEHPELGSGELFLVPVARVDEGFQYEAVFNRLVD